MPFISKDWRSPGEHWVKTEEGWEKKKILECRSPTFRRSSSSSRHLLHQQNIDPKHEGTENSNEEINYQETTWLHEEEDKENCHPRPEKEDVTQDDTAASQDGSNNVQPHCQITLKCTKEIAGFNGLSDAIKRLDFLNAVHDGRRFHYICKLLEELLSHRLASLSGCARRVLLAMLEEVACEVSASQTNMHLLQQLLDQLRHTTEWACWGHPLGSTRLWGQHLQSIERILDIAAHIQIREPGEEQETRLQQLPEECVREVLLRLSDHKDLARAGEAWGVMQRVADEQRIWRELCAFHFSPQQLSKALEEMNQPATAEPADWQQVYHKLRRMYGLKEEYTEILSLCRNCRCLFWQSLGHPCIVERDSPEVQQRVGEGSVHVPIPPHAFLKFFSL